MRAAMSGVTSGVDPELDALLTTGTVKRRLPSEMRTRTLQRARASLGGTVGSRRVPSLVIRRASPLGRGRAGRLVRVALVASVAVAGAAVGAVAALRMHGTPVPSAHSSRDTLAPVVAVPRAAARVRRPEPPTPVAEPPAVAQQRPARSGARRDPFTAELNLLQRVHAAYARHDFSTALGFVAEHARRFPDGQLAEQREALRVRSLTGSGRTDDAHRAAAAFAVRFPRSVLLPRVEGSAGSSEF